MKKLTALLLVLSIALSMAACGSSTVSSENGDAQSATIAAPAETAAPATEPASEFVSETDYVTIDGVYVDESCTDSDNSSLKLVYVFYTAFTNAENIKISSKLSKLTVNDANTYSSEKYSGVCTYMTSYYYSDYLEEIYIGESLKVVSTFKVPAAELAAGRVMAIAPYGIPDGDKIRIATDDITFCGSAEQIAQLADPEGYENAMYLYEDADDATATKISNAVNGYYWSFYVNATSYEIEFYAPNRFEVRVKALGVTNGGTYTVKNGFISCTYDSNGAVVNIPYTWENNDVSLDCTTAFDVH